MVAQNKDDPMSGHLGADGLKYSKFLCHNNTDATLDGGKKSLSHYAYVVSTQQQELVQSNSADHPEGSLDPQHERREDASFTIFAASYQYQTSSSSSK